MSDVVVIASKLEMSINCQLQEKVDEQKTNGPHTWVESRYRFYGDAYTIRGKAAPRGTPPIGFVMPDMVNEAALTVVPREHAEEWFRQNAAMPAVKNGLVWMTNRGRNYAADAAKEIVKVKSGFEPLIPNDMDQYTGKITVNDDRWPKRNPALRMDYGAGTPEGGVPENWAKGN